MIIKVSGVICIILVARYWLLVTRYCFELFSIWPPMTHKDAPHPYKTHHANNQPLPMTVHNKIKAGQNHHQSAEETAKA